MEAFYHKIRVIACLTLLIGCNSEKSTQYIGTTENNETKEILSNLKWSVKDLYASYIDSINQFQNQQNLDIPVFIGNYSQYLKNHEQFLTSHDVKDGRGLSYRIILENSSFKSVLSLRKYLIKKTQKNNNEKLVLGIIDYSIGR